METDTKSITVKKELDDTEQKMDLGVEGVKQELPENDTPLEGDVKVDAGIKKKDDTIIQIIPKGSGESNIAYLTVNGMDVDDDESITMTAEEVRSYIEKAVFDRIVNNNPLAALNKHSRAVQAEMKEKRDEFQKLAKLIDILEKDQLKFLRTDKALRKYLTKTGGVSVELPVLANSFPDETLLKRGFLSQASTAPSVKPAPAPATTPTTTPAPKSAPVLATKSAPVFATKSAPVLATKSASPAAAARKPLESSIVDKSKKSGENIECIDLTDETESPPEPAKAKEAPSFSYLGLVKHPAPLPPKPFVVPNKNLPPTAPKPRLTIKAEDRGIVLTWDMAPNTPNFTSYAQLQTFDIFGYQEQKDVPINTLLWKKIGSVKAMTLPMACTLTQFIEGNKYHFSIRAVDKFNRCGCYSDPISIVYNPTKS